jgi:hypothetical protein
VRAKRGFERRKGLVKEGGRAKMGVEQQRGLSEEGGGAKSGVEDKPLCKPFCNVNVHHLRVTLVAAPTAKAGIGKGSGSTTAKAGV